MRIKIIFKPLILTSIVSLFFLSSCRSKTSDLQQPQNKNKEIIRDDNENIQSQQSGDFNPAPLSKKFKKYEGGMFDIQYPDNFIVKTPNENVWEAYFKSPDSLVEFYVFSPWGVTENHEIEIKPEIEIEFQNEVKKKDEYSQVRYVTYRAKDNSYFRSYQDKMEYGVRTIIGLKYKNRESYEYYKDSYLKFKNSLVQYADG